MAGNEFDGYRSNYSETVNKSIAFSGLTVDFFTEAKAVRMLDILEARLGSTDKLSVLDVGCGVGSYHALLRDRLGQLTGVDPSSECLAEAEQTNPAVNYRAYDGDVIPFESGTFDAASAICVMHHIPPARRAKFTSELKRVVRPRGLALLFEHNPYNPLTRRAVSNCPFDADAVLLSMKTAKDHLRQAGFREIDGRYILSIPSIAGFARSMDDALGALPTGAQYYVSGWA